MEPQKIPSRKRRKMLVACNPCRTRKTGCDGGRPCTSCSLRGWHDRCSYQEKSLSSQAQILANLGQRIQSLERSAQTPSEEQRGDVEVPSSHFSSIALRGARESLSLTSDQLSDSAANLLLRQPISRQSASPSADTDIEEDLNPSARAFLAPRASNYGYDLTTIVLPPRSLADNLLQCYWDFTPLIFPILHRPTFEAAYSRIWSTKGVTSSPHGVGSVEDILFYSTLNMVLSLGAKGNETFASTQREKLADEFYRRSLTLISVETLDISSLEVVQLLLLRGLYLFYTPHADRCWNTVGVAVRVAQGLGLHNVSFDETSKAQLTREMRRRVWCNCVSLDRIAGHTFGHSALVAQQSLPIPAEIDDEYLSDTHTGRQPTGVPSRLSFFVYNLRLNSFLAKIDFFGTRRNTDSTNRSNTDGLGVILEVNSELDEFTNSLPNHLRTEDDVTSFSGTQKDCFKLQARLLRLRILYSRLALLRRVLLTQALQASHSSYDFMSRSTLQDKLRDDMSTLCLSTAHTVLKALQEALGSIYQNSAWHALYFAFSAASVLIAAMLCPRLEIDLNKDPGKASWNRAIQIFTFHQSHIQSAEKGIQILEAFRNRIEKRLALRNYASNIVDVGTSSPGGVASSETLFAEVAVDAVTNPTEQAGYNLDTFLDSDLLSESWFTMQDFQLDDWGLSS